MAMFQVVQIAGNNRTTPLTDHEGKPYIWENAHEAAAEAEYRTTVAIRRPSYLDYDDLWTPPKIKFQPRPVKDDAWKAREAERLASGHYLPVPPTWPNPVPEHFLHVSRDESTKVAFTEDTLKGAQDRQTRISPGRYLQRFASHLLKPPEIATLAAQYGAIHGTDDLMFANTADEIEQVYLEGPDSCMSHSPEHFRSNRHPVRVYAAGDLAVAYIKRNGFITARVLCWPAKLIYSRIYGDSDRLKPLLAEHGYTEGRLYGAKLLKIEEDGNIVAPYIDVTPFVKVTEKHLIIVPHSGYDRMNGLECQSTGGWVGYDPHDEDEDNTEDCNYCGGDYDSDEMTYITSRESCYCPRCTRNHSFECAATGNRYSNDDRVTMADGRTVNIFWFEHNGGTCEKTDNNYNADELTYLASEGISVGPDYLASHCGRCNGYYEYYIKTDLILLDDDETYSLDWMREEGNVGICNETWAVMPLRDLYQWKDGTYNINEEEPS